MSLIGFITGADKKKERAAKRKAQQDERAYNELLGGLQGVEYDPITDISHVNAVSDPLARQAQYTALDQLGGLTTGKLNEVDQYNLALVRQKQMEEEKAQRDAIMLGARRRGVLNSGDTLSANLLNQSASADRAYMGGLSTAADARQRALDAMVARGNLAGNIRGQSFKEAYQRQAFNASADNTIQQFNRGLQLQTNNQNFAQAQAKYGAKTGVNQGFYDAAALKANNLASIGGDVVNLGMAVGGAVAGRPDIAMSAVAPKKKA